MFCLLLLHCFPIYLLDRRKSLCTLKSELRRYEHYFVASWEFKTSSTRYDTDNQMLFTVEVRRLHFMAQSVQKNNIWRETATSVEMYFFIVFLLLLCAILEVNSKDMCVDDPSNGLQTSTLSSMRRCSRIHARSPTAFLHHMPFSPGAVTPWLICIQICL